MAEVHASKHLEHPLIWPETIEFRLYQKSIAEVASDRNTLIILPTALGKTVISAMVAADLLYNYRNVKVLVMAPTRPLVLQHRNNFLRLLKLREKDTALLTGETYPEYRKIVWEGEARVVFSTPQVVRNDLLEHRFSLENYGLLVFDECHRAVKEYAYTDIAQFYVSQAMYPRILGMTASPGSDLNRVLDVCRNLYIERVEYRSEDDPDVKPYVQPIEIEWKRVNLPREYLEIRSQITSLLDIRVSWLCHRGMIKRKPEYVTRRSLIEAGNDLRFMLEESIEEERGQILTAIIYQSMALTLFHVLELLETQGLRTLKAFLEKVELEKAEKRSYAILTGDPEYKRLRASVESISTEHPKVQMLKQIVREQVSRKPSSRMLAFTQYRDTASHLVEELNTIPGVRADRFVGQASKLLDKGLTQDEQAERIRMLEAGELNVLVATSIAEEGLDIPAVDHVIFYEPIPSEIRYIQRRGRTGRKTSGNVTILAAIESLDMVYLYASQKRTEKMKTIAESINLKLQPIIRKRSKPSADPLTLQELKTLEKEAMPVKIEPKLVIPEVETLREFDRNVERSTRTLYMKLLERGASGADMSQIASDMEYEGVSLPVLKATVEKMVKKGLIAEIRKGKYAVTSAAKLTDERVYDITIEKIYPNAAVLIVDDKFRARLTPEEYNGPKALIRKNSRFRATADLFRLDGTLCIRVKEIVETLD
jgi:Fanconi anemia group M protein